MNDDKAHTMNEAAGGASGLSAGLGAIVRNRPRPLWSAMIDPGYMHEHTRVMLERPLLWTPPHLTSDQEKEEYRMRTIRLVIEHDTLSLYRTISVKPPLPWRYRIAMLRCLFGELLRLCLGLECGRNYEMLTKHPPA